MKFSRTNLIKIYLASFKILHEYRQMDGQRERVVLVDAGQDSIAPKGCGFLVTTNGILRESIRSSFKIGNML